MRDNSDFFRVNKIEGKTFVSFDLDVNGGYDEISCGALKLETPEFIMPVNFEKGTGIVTARYTVPEGYINLKELKKFLMIEEILKLYSSIYTYFEVCSDWYLVPEGFCFNPEQVYLNGEANSFMFIYIPDGRQSISGNNIKQVFISLLERCEESSGGKIQLQLYKYFYKPTFNLEEFKVMIDKFKDELCITTTDIKDAIKEHELENSSLNNDEFMRNDFMNSDFMKEEISIEEISLEEPALNDENNVVENVDMGGVEVDLEDINQSIELDSVLDEVSDISMNDDWVNPYEAKPNPTESSKEENLRSVYSPQPNRSQLSQEEIEEMVKSIYSSQGSEEDENSSESASDNDIIMQDKTMNSNKRSNAYGASKKDENSNDTKKRNMLDNVFNGPKPSKSESANMNVSNKTAVLKAISTHTRYDLPKLIRVDFESGKFIIGRATRTGEPTGANYEFGAEITPISRIHAQLEIKDNEYYITDLGSSNGTFLNGTKLETDKPCKVEDGDKIALAIAFSKNSIEYMFQE